MTKHKIVFALGLIGLLAGAGFLSLTPAAAQEGLKATIVNPPPGSVFKVGENILFQGTATGGVGQYAYVWDFGDGTKGGGQSYEKQYTAAGDYTITLTVTDENKQKATAEVKITIKQDGGQPKKPVISNLRVTDITSTSVIVRWTTDVPADSRVIYDTVSHPNLQGCQAPNFCYSSSTETKDPSGVTDHAVTIAGLTPKTTYYFRALSRGL